MRLNPSFAASVLALALASQAPAHDGIAKILLDPASEIDRPADRARTVEWMAAIENARLQKARAAHVAVDSTYESCHIPLIDC